MSRILVVVTTGGQVPLASRREARAVAQHSQCRARPPTENHGAQMSAETKSQDPSLVVDVTRYTQAARPGLRVCRCL